MPKGARVQYNSLVWDFKSEDLPEILEAAATSLRLLDTEVSDIFYYPEHFGETTRPGRLVVHFKEDE